MPAIDKDCLFCKIVAEESPADIIYQDDQVLAFRDINPQAPVHVLLVPKEHIAYAADLEESQKEILFKLVDSANKIAKDEGITEGYRLVINNGSGAGQTVFHLHLHLLGGRPMNWPPG